MERYVEPTEQLALELFVSDIHRAKAFYEHLGCSVTEDRGTFVVLRWEGHLFMLDERPDLPPSTFPPANVRVMVPDVDRCWRRVVEVGAPVLNPIGDRPYGLRDFTILDPDGFGVRFASRLPGRPRA